MKVLNLQCAHQHGFEGWFASEDDFRQQLERGLLSCPVCGEPSVHKLPSAPRLNLGHAREPEARPAPAVAAPGSVDMAAAPALQGLMLRALRELMHKTEDVGERFADEARKIHYGEREERGIRGQASPEQTRELIEEGIAVMPLPLPDGLKGPLQ